SLADLAARIRAEHEACASALKRGLDHAITAGRLLIEAKGKHAHGGWLPWLHEHCQVPERTAQAYMRCARTFGTLDEANTQRVGDLSPRDSLGLLPVAGSAAKKAGTLERLIERRVTNPAETWYQARAVVDLEDREERRTGKDGKARKQPAKRKPEEPPKNS